MFRRTIFAFVCGALLSQAKVPEVYAQHSGSAPSSPATGRLDDSLTLRPCRSGLFADVCYEDANGTEQYRVSLGKIYSAEVRRRQERYNDWYATLRDFIEIPIQVVETPERNRSTYYSRPEGAWDGDFLVLPFRIRETGRLDLDTVAIPYYRTVHRLLSEAKSLRDDCVNHYTSGDYESRTLCEAVLRGYRLDRWNARGPLTSQDLQRFDGSFLTRVALLKEAYAKSAEFGRSVLAVFQGIGRSEFDLAIDGFDADEIPADRLQAMESADLRLAVALELVEWAAESYRSRRSSPRK